MITGNTTWTAQLAANWKRPLYIFEIPSQGIVLTSFTPSLVAATPSGARPFMFIPQGAGQQISDLEGASSISQVDVTSIDPTSELKLKLAIADLIGSTATLKLGFPGMAYADFVVLHTMQLIDTGWLSDGKIVFRMQDVQRFVKETIWLNGGPTAWTVGSETPAQPSGESFAANDEAVSDKNPRWVQGNPIDILLVALQNELGIGQASEDPDTWTLYAPGDDTTLINPNTYIDVAQLLALRDSNFAADWMEFKITRPEEGKRWLEQQILKPLGLFSIIRSTGELTFKSLKYPASLGTTVAWDQRSVMGIPSLTRLPVINVVTVRMNAENTEKSTSSRTFNQEITFRQTVSSQQYKQQMKHQVEALGLRVERGGNGRAFLTADRIFKRRAFGTPRYGVKTHFRNLAPEPGDYVVLTHPLVPDVLTGTMGLVNVLCEVINRQPDYAGGSFSFDLLDTRFMQAAAPYEVAPAGMPVWASASQAEKDQYMFLSSGSPAVYSDGTAAHAIF